MSTIIATTLSNGTVSVPTATVVNGSAKAWVNVNGITTTAIRGSHNLSSVTDSGTGDTSYNFTNAMVDTNYASVNSTDGSGVSSSAVVFSSTIRGNSTSLVKTITLNTSGTALDLTQVNLSVFGDLA